jgi:Ca2+-binding RTX toxin-like protein
MNADGACEVAWAPALATWTLPQRRPGASLASGPSDCASGVLRLRPDGAEIGVRDRVQLRVTVHNDGTQPLRNLRVTLSVLGGTLSLPDRCIGLVCNLGTLAPGDEAQLEFSAASRSAGDIEIGASASYDAGPDVFPADNKANVVARVFPCDVLGTMRVDRLDGTPQRDRICGRAGNDWIVAKAGNDEIEAGPGRDTVEAGRGKDDIFGEAGADLIIVNDGETDLVDCGTGIDTVIADRKDILHKCEWVRRR